MGLYDNVRCRYPLPDPEAQDRVFQTKSTPAPYLEDYEITADGRLLHQAYDTRVEEDTAAPFGFFFHRDNLRWEPVDFSGQLELHEIIEHPDGRRLWYSYLVWFRKGHVADLQHGPGHGQCLPDKPTLRTP